MNVELNTWIFTANPAENIHDMSVAFVTLSH